MKVNLLLDNPGDVRSGYLNIDGAAIPADCQIDGRMCASVSDLSHTVDVNELDELIAMDILDYFPLEEADKIIDHWLSLLKHGGKLTVGMVDLRQVAREVLANSIDIADVNELLYGKQEKPWQFKKCVCTAPILVNILRAKGHIIERKLAVNNRAIVTVRRK